MFSQTPPFPEPNQRPETQSEFLGWGPAPENSDEGLALKFNSRVNLKI